MKDDVRASECGRSQNEKGIVVCLRARLKEEKSGGVSNRSAAPLRLEMYEAQRGGRRDEKAVIRCVRAVAENKRWG